MIAALFDIKVFAFRCISLILYYVQSEDKKRVNNILSRLYRRAEENKSEYIEDVARLERQIRRKLHWSDDDLFKYFSFTEEVSPDLSEEFALRKMSEIYKKYEETS